MPCLSQELETMACRVGEDRGGSLDVDRRAGPVGPLAVFPHGRRLRELIRRAGQRGLAMHCLIVRRLYERTISVVEVVEDTSGIDVSMVNSARRPAHRTPWHQRHVGRGRRWHGQFGLNQLGRHRSGGHEPHEEHRDTKGGQARETVRLAARRLSDPHVVAARRTPVVGGWSGWSNRFGRSGLDADHVRWLMCCCR